jgi:N-acetyl-alpha-D-muramate 1-phosphate uridylyltransferase
MKAVILAGGLAKRLGDLTKATPKALIDVAGKPFLWHQLQLLRKNRVEGAILLVGHLGEQIQDQFGDGSIAGLPLEYSYDGPVLLGTGGAIRRALRLLPERFFVLYGDSYLPCDYRAVEDTFLRSGCEGLMTVYRNEGRFDTSNVEFDGTRIIRYDKKDRTPDMHHIDYGLEVFRRDVFARLPENQPVDLAAVCQSLLREGRLGAFEVHQRFYEIGSRQGIADTAEFLSLQKPAP